MSVDPLRDPKPKRPLTPELIRDVIDETLVRMALKPGVIESGRPMDEHPEFQETFKQVCDDLGFPTMADMGFDPMMGRKNDN